MPFENKKEILELDAEIKNGVKFIYVSNYMDIYKELKVKKERKIMKNDQILVKQ